jgi:UDP-N-acetylmuramyl pentapeptide phosphotransferase/UDP-N-acetylglucosamine-1-phosphate transferase
MGDLNGYFIVGFCAMIVTLIATPIVRSFAKKRNWVAVPDERKVHTVATPDVGGIAMFAGVVVALGLAWQMDRFSPLFRGNSEPRGILLAALLILVIGVIEYSSFKVKCLSLNHCLTNGITHLIFTYAQSKTLMIFVLKIKLVLKSV